MYRYDEFDAAFVRERVDEFRDQVARRLSGELTEPEFRPLRLMNGLYLQLHAYMLRVAIPYGTLSSRQMRQLALIADKFDRGYGHFTTRQNIQYNWPKLAEVPDLLEHLAEVEMHAIQTSGNCIRNTTADPWAGVAADEVADPRPTAELIRQWSSLHPEFSFLPRKFKIAVTGSEEDRAAVAFHDIGLRVKENTDGYIGYEVLAGGGQGRTPMVAITVREWVSEDELLPYLEAIMRVYNLHGRRDNKYKARIKILVHELGAEAFRDEVEAAYAAMNGASVPVPEGELERIRTYFTPPSYGPVDLDEGALDAQRAIDPNFARWIDTNVAPHRVDGHAIVTISLKPIGGVPGDATSDQMRAVATLADQFSHGEIRVTYEQNLILPHVAKSDLYQLWRALETDGLATANAGLVTDIISCPGLDYCQLATARSIPVAQSISERLGDADRQKQIGELKIKISGCINACGHHHAGHIGILGLEKRGEEFYQITLGGNGDKDAAIGEILGPGFSRDGIVDAIETVVDTYVDLRQPDESFLEAYSRTGPTPFKEALYGAR